MTVLLQIDENKLADELVSFFARYEESITQAEPLFELGGERLEILIRNLPHHQMRYDQLAQEAKQLVKWLENYKSRIEARLTKNYLNGQRAFGARETSVLISGEKDMIEHNQLIVEASLYQQRLESIVESFKQMGWMLSNIVKLRVASLNDIIL